MESASNCQPDQGEEASEGCKTEKVGKVATKESASESFVWRHIELMHFIAPTVNTHTILVGDRGHEAPDSTG